MKLIDVGVAELISQAYAGTMEGGNFFGEVGLAPFHDFDGIVTDEMRATRLKVLGRPTKTNPASLDSHSKVPGTRR